MQVILSRQASKHFQKIPAVEKKKIKRKLLSLGKNPLIGKKLDAELYGERSLRAWPYRIIYFINKTEDRVEVSDILHRQGAYK